jgi:hypothetical protein
LPACVDDALDIGGKLTAGVAAGADADADTDGPALITGASAAKALGSMAAQASTAHRVEVRSLIAESLS